jgi:hypothetical protein
LRNNLQGSLRNSELDGSLYDNNVQKHRNFFLTFPSRKVCNPLMEKTVVSPQKNEEISKLKEWVHCPIVKQMDSCLHMTEIQDFVGHPTRIKKEIPMK